MKRKILMIGGTGTISRPITQLLSRDSTIDLYLLNRGHNNDDLDDRVHFLIGDINNKDEIRKLIKDHLFDVVVNFILFDGKDAYDQIELFNGKVKQYVFVSTVAALNHEPNCHIDEETERGNRFSVYGQNKAMAEQILLNAYEQQGFPITIVRPSQTYSNERLPLSVKGDSTWAVIQRMIDGKEVIVHGDGQSIWASTHADDFAPPFVSLLDKEKTIGEIYQIMNNEPHTWDMVYQEIAKQLGVEYKPIYISKDILKQSRKYDFLSSIQGDKTFSNLYDISKIQSWYPELKFEIGLEEGVRRFLAYMEENPYLKAKDSNFDFWCDSLIIKYSSLLKTLTANL